MELIECDVCKAEGIAKPQWSGHTTVSQNLCCRHYIIAGGSPASWHPECLRVYAEMKGVPPEKFVREVAKKEMATYSTDAPD